MSIRSEDLSRLVELSMEGEYQRHSIDQFCQTYPDITEEEAYRGQAMRVRRMEERGYCVVGYKLGGTSLAKQRQLRAAIYSNSSAAAERPGTIAMGRLMDYMRLPENAPLQIGELLHPKVEPEFAFIMGKDIAGQFVTVPDVMMATAEIAPAFEVIDSRFHDFKIGRRCDAIIDNVSSARFKLGVGRLTPNEFDLGACAMKLWYNGEYVGFGAGASVMGHPARAVAALVRALSREGLGLRTGDIVLSGAISGSVSVKAGDRLRADFGCGLGFVELEIV